MLTQMARNWGWVLVRGILAILFGVLAFVMPGLTFLTLLTFLAAYLVVDGILTIITAIANRKSIADWGWVLVQGIISLIAGIIAFVNPGLTGLTLIYIIAAWAVISGIMIIIAAIRLRREISGELWLVLSGVISIVLGIALFANPDAGAIAVVYTIGAYAVLTGILLVLLAFRLRNLRNTLTA